MADIGPTRSNFPTPKHEKANKQINSILNRLRDAGLPISSSDQPSSPSSRGNSPAENVSHSIRFLYFHDRTELQKIVERCANETNSCSLDGTARLKSLDDSLRDAARLTAFKPKYPDIRSSFTASKPGLFSQLNSRISEKSPTTATSCEEEPQINRGKPAPPLAMQKFESFHSTSSEESATSTVFDRPSGLQTAETSFNTLPAIEDDFQATQGSNYEYGSPSLLDELSNFQEPKFYQCANEDLTADGQPITPSKALGSTHRSDTRRTMRTSDNLDECPPVDSPHRQLQTELQSSTHRLSVSFLLRNLPKEQMVTFHGPEWFNKHDFVTRWLLYCVYLAERSKLNDVSDPDYGLPPSERSIQVWLKKKLKSFEIERQKDQTFSARLVLKMQRGRRTLLEFSPSKPSDDALCRLERRFDHHRFLTVIFEYPDRNSLKDLGGSDPEATFRGYFREFLRQPQNILGTTFELFHMENMERKDNVSRMKLRYFATYGPKIGKRIDAAAVIDWVLAVSNNSAAMFAKLWARMDLSLSRTMSTITFMPHQVRLCQPGSTIYADGSPESVEFNDSDPCFTWKLPEKAEVMNDGCGRISTTAARNICEQLGLSTPWPVVFQARVNGSKGLWSIAEPYHSQDSEVWIDINETQLKVKPHPADMRDDSCEPGKWTFELVTYSTPPPTSYLYSDFLPILENRGVDRGTIIQIIEEQLKMDFVDVKTSLEKRTTLRGWLGTNFAAKEIRNREAGIPYLFTSADDSRDDYERAILLMESGFDASSNRTLAEYVLKILNWWLQDLVKKLKIRSDRTVMPFGIADPTGCLAPGEICMNFSRAPAEVPNNYLVGEVLVARQPALRNSDIQKVKAVYKPELSYLKDVVVFSSKGSIPLASKLQGGDYDGDKFWICWDERLVRPFKNAPVPSVASQLEYYGIKQSKLSVQEVLQSANVAADYDSGGTLDNNHAMIHAAIPMAFEEDMLGRVTNAHKRLAYRRNKLDDDDVEHLANIHDLVIDSRKNGYCWSEIEFKKFMASLGLPAYLKKPLYEEALEKDIRSSRGVQYQRKTSEFILDTIVLGHVLPRAQEFLYEVECIVNLKGDAETPLEQVDPDLCKPYEDLQILAQTSETAAASVKHLKLSLNKLLEEWGSRMSVLPDEDHVKIKATSAALERCRQMYQQIMPVEAHQSHAGKKHSRDNQNELIWSWCYRRSPESFSLWDIWRASALYHHRTSSRRHAASRSHKSKLALLLAGRELSQIKVEGCPGWRSMTGDLHGICRPRKQKNYLAHGRWGKSRRDESDEE